MTYDAILEDKSGVFSLSIIVILFVCCCIFSFYFIRRYATPSIERALSWVYETIRHLVVRMCGQGRELGHTAKTPTVANLAERTKPSLTYKLYWEVWWSSYVMVFVLLLDGMALLLAVLLCATIGSNFESVVVAAFIGIFHLGIIVSILGALLISIVMCVSDLDRGSGMTKEEYAEYLEDQVLQNWGIFKKWNPVALARRITHEIATVFGSALSGRPQRHR